MSNIRFRVHTFVHKYLEVSEDVESIIVDYALKTWQEPERSVKYLQILGEYGTVKKRAGAVMTAICNKPITANGTASSAAVIRMMDDQFPCTLIIDEAENEAIVDSEEVNPFMKILNAGWYRSTGILRMVEVDGEYEVRAFNVFGYKVILSRDVFEDNALQSRCISVELNGLTRDDIPLDLGGEFEADREAIQWDLLDHFSEAPF